MSNHHVQMEKGKEDPPSQKRHRILCSCKRYSKADIIIILSVVAIGFFFGQNEVLIDDAKINIILVLIGKTLKETAPYS